MPTIEKGAHISAAGFLTEATGGFESMANENWNPYFRALWVHCSAKPAAAEDHPWGETVFKICGKVFAFLGYPDSSTVTVKARPDDRVVLLSLPHISTAAYVGRFGWITVSIEDEDTLALALDLVDESYDLIAGPKKRSKRKNKELL
jgi:predicted DNA-binding protein (MmcQ/YjbR family)